ncbi:hypothetical protein JQC92_14695 [Shewanella sp. 202IG2-18]|uniref:hypothetical protein n=1 Tax=Parashewanella hymeniacidonis TaxID=2807618 RepID=UPI0019611A8F|nr:hypothetical protein [Parashewanella hymeniacidonis]MBM7073260.1 hypothetical protein [Parashewanella hymeniacidonis]
MLVLKFLPKWFLYYIECRCSRRPCIHFTRLLFIENSFWIEYKIGISSRVYQALPEELEKLVIWYQVSDKELEKLHSFQTLNLIYKNLMPFLADEQLQKFVKFVINLSEHQ